MTGIVIGASKEAIYAIQTAKELGHYVIAIDGSQDAEGLKYADQSIVIDIREPENVIQSLEGFTPDFVIPVPIGRYLTTTGYVSEQYGLKSLGYESSIACTDKFLFHKKLQENGLRQIDCYCAKKEQMSGIMQDIKYPIIVKPRHGSGSREVYLVHSKDELVKEVIGTLSLDEEYIIETMIDGDEYGIDAAVIDGQFSLVLLRKKYMTPPPYCQCIAYESVIRNEKNEQMFHYIEQYMREAVKVLGVDHCLLHADLMVQENGEVTAIEISGRPSGHKLHDIFTPLASGVDMIRQYLYYVSGEQYDFKSLHNQHMLIRYFDFQNCRVIQKPDFEYLRKQYQIKEYQINIDDEYLGIVKDGYSIMDRGYFILSGESEENLFAKSKEIMDLFECV